MRHELTPVAGVCRNPLLGLQPRDMLPVPAGVPIASLAPATAGLLLCRVNGEWLLRESWQSLTRPGDVIEWHDLPQDNDSLRSVLLIVAAVVINIYAPGAGAAFAEAGYGSAAFGSAAFSVGATLAATYAINALLPPTPLQLGAEQAARATGNPLTSSLAGNQARLDQPIWKVCGRREFNPPFAAQPYFRFEAQEGAADPQLDRDQFYYALFAIGIGDHDVFAKIGNTPIARFQDVLTAAYRAPGVAPSDVDPNVWTSGEVSNQTLDPGRAVGGYYTPPERLATQIGIDVMAPRGLGKTSSLTVSWRVEYRQIGEFGEVLGLWTILASESRTAFTSTPQRWSNDYALPSPMRVEVRVVRTDIKDISPNALHEIAWIGMRAYMAEAAPLNAATAHYEIVMRASSQLSNQASRDLRIVAEAKTRTWSSSTGWSATTVHTRNWVWWLLDLATSAAWGLGLPDSRIDLATFEALAAEAELRQDRFDYVFDSASDCWDAMQTIARAGRARVFRRNGVLTCARDGLADLPVTAFTPRNCKAGSMVVREKLRRADSPDGVIVEYQDLRSWEWVRITCGVPGVADGAVANPVVLRLPGIVGARHAEREGRYEAANLLYRNRTFELVTEMEGLLPAYMSPVKCQADIDGYGQTGDVVAWDAATLTLTLTEAPNFAGGTPQITLVRDDGTLTTPVTVTAGAGDFDVVLPAAPDFQPSYADGTRERTRWLLSTASGFDIVKVLSISDGGNEEGAQFYSLVGVIDDDRVHEADNALLPVGDEVQDPVGYPDDTPAGETYIPALGNSDGIYEPADKLITSHTFKINGVEMIELDGAASVDLSDQWLLGSPWTDSVGALFEIRFDFVIGSAFGAGSDAAGTWLSLGTQRKVTRPTGTFVGEAIVFDVRIRDAATATVQATARMSLMAYVPP